MKKNKLSTLCAIATLAIITGCGGVYSDYDVMGNIDPHDKPTNLDKKDFAKSLLPAPKPETKLEVKEPPLPKFTETLTAPKAPKIASDKNITISVTDDVPLKDVFIELSRLADVNIEIDPKITGSVIFKAKDMPFSEVVERICDLANLRYSVNGGVIRVENDTPYVENYKASFLNIVRKNTSQIGTSTKLASAGSSGSSGGSSGGSSSGSEGVGSSSSITANNGGEGDLWKSLESEIRAIVGLTAKSDKAEGDAGGQDYVSLNREVGIISVKTTAKNQKKVKEYLDKVQSYYSAQVLIEAKVVEVTLNDEYSSGIDWTAVSGSKGLGLDVATTNAEDDVFATLSFARGNLTSAINFAQTFGTTRTLSSPRILVMNNQQSVISFAKNESYFSIKCDVTDAEVNESTGEETKPAKLSVSSQLNTIPIGVILSLQPSIDLKNQEITMNIRPTLSRILDVNQSKQDPGAIICAANAVAIGLENSTIEDLVKETKIPQVDVREMDSVLRIKSGEIMAIGGMIEQRNENTDTGVPGASDVPIFGSAFKKSVKNNTAVQTVIFLKATIVPGYGVDEPDQKFYNKFNTDPRPLNFK